MPRLSYAEHLPIFAKKDEIVSAVRENPVVIVSGDTGSGKSTQLPKMCLEAERGIDGKIGCTQPRRIAAVTIARRIAEELGERIGKSVGYKIRFQDRSHASEYIKIMTDGILLAETQRDRDLYQYDTLIIDEAHERSINIDFLLGLLKTLLERRDNLKIVVTSATIDTERFSTFFNNAPVVNVEGRLYPVDLHYLPIPDELEKTGEITYVDMAVQAVEELRKRDRAGHMLIFMPTEQDIRETCAQLEARSLPGIKVLPLFARLTSRQQRRVFSPLPGQKIVVATNVAETSVTIPGIKYVIDTGLARIPRYLPRSRTTSLTVGPIAKSSADQRKGRCGRVQHGVCIRLYSEDDFLVRPEFTEPEILRSNLAEVILRMLSLNLGDIQSFPFIDPPSSKRIKDGFDILKELGAIEDRPGRTRLTERGVWMARIPLDPRLSRMILEAVREGCVAEVAVVAAALSIQDPRERPIDNAEEADRVHAAFNHPNSDFITLINLWDRFQRHREDHPSQNQLRRFCKTHFLSFVRMREWCDIHQQIVGILEELGIDIVGELPYSDSKARYEAIHRSVLSGCLSNIGMIKEKNHYHGAKGRELMVFPGSTLFNKASPWIAAAEVVKTSRLFARIVARIQPQWLEALGHELCRYTYSNPRWVKNRREVRADERVTLYGLPVVEGRSVPFGPVRPGESHRIFIQAALVEGRMKAVPSFLRHNQAMIGRLRSMEDKLRRRDILIGEQEIAEFYSRRLPGIYDVRGLKKRILEKGGDAFLRMGESDLLRERPDPDRLSAFPDWLDIRGHRFYLSYRFTPGEEEDGVTLTIPASLAPKFPVDRLDWLVPGLFSEKISTLIKGLPKRYRKQLVPVSDAAATVVSEMPVTEEALVNALSRFIYRRFGIDIPALVWPQTELPRHLQMRLSLIDQNGTEIRSGRDPGLLGAIRPEGPVSKPLQMARKQWERTGIRSWDFGNLPREIPVGSRLIAYPALVPGEEGTDLRLFDDPQAALEKHREGVEVLLSLQLKRNLKGLKGRLALPSRLEKAALHFGGTKALENALYQRLCRDLLRMDIRTEMEFHSHAQETKRSITAEAKELLGQTCELLQALEDTHSTLFTLEHANRSNGPVVELCRRIHQELQALLPEDFLARYSRERLANLPRYIKAMRIRAERGANDVEKDRKKALELEGFLTLLTEIKAGLSGYVTDEKCAAVDAFRWMIEEYKVSLFAPELKTPYPVSPKRLKEKAEAIRRMV